MVGVPFHFADEGAVILGLDAHDHRQVLVGDILFSDRAGAARNGGEQAVDLDVPGGEAALTVLLGDRIAEAGDLGHIRDVDHLGEEIPFAKLLAGLRHVTEGGKRLPHGPFDLGLHSLVTSDLLGAGGGHDASGDVLIEGLRILVPDLGMGAHQVKEEGSVGLFIPDDQQDPDALALDLEDAEQVHDRAAPLALLEQGAGGGLRDACKARGALYPVPEDGFGLGEQIVELLRRGVEDGKDGRDVVKSVAAAGSEHEGFPPAKRLAQTGGGEDHVGIGGGEFLGRVTFLVQEFHEVRGNAVGEGGGGSGEISDS